MPKIHNTRLQRGKELLDLLQQGPAGIDDQPSWPEFTKKDYDLWFNTWVHDQLIDLVPELRKEAFAQAAGPGGE